MSDHSDLPSAPAVVERFVKSLVVANKAVALYPPASTIPRDTSKDAAAVLHEALKERSELRINIAKDGLYFDGAKLLEGQKAYENFALDLYSRNLADVRFHAGTSERDIVAFLSVLKSTPEEVAAAGGFETRLWDQGIATITVTEVNVTIVDSGSVITSDQTHAPALTRERIEELLSAAYAGRPRDQIVVARFLADRKAVAAYIAETYAMREAPDIVEAGERFAELAELAFLMRGETDQRALIEALGEALQELDPDLARELLIEEVLPEARTNEALAAVLRQMDIDDVCRMLVADIDADNTSRAGLARAIRNLALISVADREEVATAAGAAMVGAGYSPTAAREVLEVAQPTRLNVREHPRPGVTQEKPAEAILHLLGLAAGSEQITATEDDPALVELRTEARQGISDGEVIMALVSIATLDPRDQQFAATMAVLEDSLDLLIERGDLVIAADAADALRAAATNPELSVEQRRRLERAIGRFTKPGDIKTVARALKLYAAGTGEYEAARRLLDSLGALAIEPLLEQLAEEQDMAARKSLVDLLSNMATDFVPELGAHVSDNRWYVVRNVVSILGTTRSSAVLSYLERTLRHPEPRVRRETIRALSGISDRISQEMLRVALADDDAQNVQLAARYLGKNGVTAALPQLEQVARGEGRGNRDMGPRVEAIEALGALGDQAALPTLEAIAGKRSILGGGKARELRAAAETAIGAIKSRGGVS